MAEIIVLIFAGIFAVIMLLMMILLVAAECYLEKIVKEEMKKYPTIRIGE